MKDDAPQILPPGATNFSQTTILIVEDDDDIGHLLVQALEDEFGCKVILATDGLQALTIVETLLPDLFLLDYLLPSINGLELYHRLQRQETLARIPKILMSAHLPRLTDEQSSILTLKKPFDLDDFFSMIRQVLTPPSATTQ